MWRWRSQEGFGKLNGGKAPSPSILMAATRGTYKVLMALLHFDIKTTVFICFTKLNFKSVVNCVDGEERGVKTNEVSLMRSLVQRQEKVVVTVGGGLETPPLVENTNFNLHKYILQFAHTFGHLAKYSLQFGQKHLTI